MWRDALCCVKGGVGGCNYSVKGWRSGWLSGGKGRKAWGVLVGGDLHRWVY